MRIIFAGTSHGIPEADRRCSCTLIEISGRYYFLDMGMNPMEELKRRSIPIDKVYGVFITHCHSDHTNGLIPFADLLNWYYKDANPAIFIPQQRMIDAVRSWIEASCQPDRNLKMNIVPKGLVYSDGFITVTSIPNEHIAVSYSYLIQAEGKAILFTGDLSRDFHDFPRYDGDIDLLVCETAHYSPVLAIDFINQTKAKHVIFTHINPYRHGDALEKVLADNHPYTVEKAFDGKEISV